MRALNDTKIGTASSSSTSDATQGSRTLSTGSCSSSSGSGSNTSGQSRSLETSDEAHPSGPRQNRHTTHHHRPVPIRRRRMKGRGKGSERLVSRRSRSRSRSRERHQLAQRCRSHPPPRRRKSDTKRRVGGWACRSEPAGVGNGYSDETKDGHSSPVGSGSSIYGRKDRVVEHDDIVFDSDPMEYSTTRGGRSSSGCRGTSSSSSTTTRVRSPRLDYDARRRRRRTLLQRNKNISSSFESIPLFVTSKTKLPFSHFKVMHARTHHAPTAPIYTCI